MADLTKHSDGVQPEATKSLPYVPSKRIVVIDGYPFRKYRWSDGKWGRDEPSYRALRLFLIDKYGVCFFCGRQVKDYPHQDRSGFHDDLGTIDHLKPRTTHKGVLGRKRYQVVEKVLACHRCNHDRNVQHQKTKPEIQKNATRKEWQNHGE